MSILKKYRDDLNVLKAARERISFTFDNFERIYVSFSAGKDSTVMLHLVMEEARKRQRKVGVMLVDLEAQYKMTMDHASRCFEAYADVAESYWVCLPLSLRNAVSNYEPRWLAWDPTVRTNWVREFPETPGLVRDPEFFPFFQSGMEFEEFVPLFGEWYSQGKTCACLVGIRTDESLNRFRTIALSNKTKFHDKSYTTKVTEHVFNVYPIYDWGVGDLWHYHYLNPRLSTNDIYEQMHKAGLSPSQMRICQPYGDDQRRGLWLYHILEPKTWYKVVNRVNGVNSGALYIRETGNMTGYNKITKPDNHTWKSFCNLLLASLPENTSAHYIVKFKTFIKWWKARGYSDGIPDESPLALENAKQAPSWRRLCKVLLRNDYWCKGLAFTQPKSAAYGRYIQMRDSKTLLKRPRYEVDEDQD
jgi:predicted phosphoadenosine phosphosulfate sulfurtransferase